MKKILIIGASVLQLPAIIKAKELGYHVVVVDFNPKAVGIKYADEYYNISTIDQDSIIELAEKLKPDGIMTLATDMPMRALARATEKLKLPGISLDTAIKATDKGEMRKAFRENDIESPWFYVVHNEEDLKLIMKYITYPCVMKPTDNAGNRGVCFVDSQENLIRQFEYSFQNSRYGHVIIEEYMEGKEVSVEIIVYKGKVHILAVTDKLTLGKPYFVEIGHAQQSMLDKKDVAAIRDLASRAVLALGINNSPAHVEIMLTKDGPKMVELGARLGGGGISTHLVPLSTGVDLVKADMDIAMGIEPEITPKFNKGSALRHIVGIEGKIVSIKGIKEAMLIPGVKEIVMMKGIGDVVSAFHNGADRIGYVISQADSTNEAIEICNNALSIIKIETE